MGIIDSMAIGSMAATGVLEFSTGPALWFLIVGLLAATAGAIALSGLRLPRLARPTLPRLAQTRLIPATLSRAK